MAGNVREWVADWYVNEYYSYSHATNPLGPAYGETRVVRGGSWDAAPYDIRTASRENESPGGFSGSLGFRCARSP